MLHNKRRPTPPGQILRHEFLEPLDLSPKKLAEALGISPGASKRGHPG